jgi:hypothetical protein
LIYILFFVYVALIDCFSQRAFFSRATVKKAPESPDRKPEEDGNSKSGEPLSTRKLSTSESTQKDVATVSGDDLESEEDKKNPLDELLAKNVVGTFSICLSP